MHRRVIKYACPHCNAYHELGDYHEAPDDDGEVFTCPSCQKKFDPDYWEDFPKFVRYFDVPIKDVIGSPAVQQYVNLIDSYKIAVAHPENGFPIPVSSSDRQILESVFLHDRAPINGDVVTLIRTLSFHQLRDFKSALDILYPNVGDPDER